MRETDRRWPWAWRRLGVTAVAGALLFGAAACGTGPEETKVVTRSVASQATAQAVPTAAAEVAASRQAEVHKRLRELEASFQGRIGAYAFDTGTGQTVGYRTRERFPFLSTFKALAAAAVLHKARRQDPGLMERVVTWTSDEVKPNSPVTEDHTGPDKGLTVAQLCDAAIRFSDNTAGNMLLKQLGGPAGLTRYLRSLGDPVSRLDRWEIELNDWSPGAKPDTTTPANAGTDLYRVTAGKGLVEQDRQRLIGWLKDNTTGGTRIRAGLPNWTVGDKTGSNNGMANDIAIAWPPGSTTPVIFSIYTYRLDPAAPRDEKVLADTAAILARGLGKTP